MAKPRVFISSTYFDLKNVRADLERFVREQGFDPILHERGNVPYGKETALEEYCYREIGGCDIIVAIVGGRYGAASKLDPYSISQMELKTAHELQKPIYVFVERDVLAEYRTYTKNKDGAVEWVAVNDVRIYRFLDEVFALKVNNPVSAFDTSLDITLFLKEQWAGLFQRLLQEGGQQEQMAMIREMRESIQTLRQLVDYLVQEKNQGSEAVTQILLMNHPAFSHLQRLLNVKYRVFFTNHIELEHWLKARSFRVVMTGDWDDPNYEEWINKADKKKHVLLKLSDELFDQEGRLKVIAPADWQDELIQLTELTPSDDDDIPF
ncbi:MAG TPA: DUF4062 domain-containing protein [Burkholderiaceae bacterium]